MAGMIQNETGALQNTAVDRLSQEKLYLQLTRILLNQITSGQWKTGRQIPTESELCQAYGVSKITVRQAIKNLVADGYLMKIQGKGTFVRKSVQASGFAMKTRFTEDMFGKEVQVEREVLIRDVLPGKGTTLGYLKTSDDIYRIVSQRVVEGEPISLDESYIPAAILPEALDLDFTNRSLLSMLQERGTVTIYKIVQTVEIADVPTEFATKLRVKEGTPVLVVHRLFFGRDDTPVSYTRFLGRSDHYKFQTEFERIR